MELQTSPEKSIVETAVTETAATETETAIQPVKVAKQFVAGLFIGEVTAVNIKRGRNYILYCTKTVTEKTRMTENTKRLEHCTKR